MELDALRIDPSRETDGVWVKYEGGIEFRIARLGNPEYTKYIEKHSQANLKRLRNRKNIDMEGMSELTKKAVAYHVLKGWKGITEGGKELPYSPERALEIFNDSTLQPIYRFILESADDEDSYRQETVEDSEKNCENVSAGT